MNDVASLGLIVPGMPHVLLAPDDNAGWGKLRDAFAEARERIIQTDADMLVLYSTQWASVIGHQIQADPEPEWNHVDQEWHDLGSMPYKFRIDVDFANAYEHMARNRGLTARTVAYKGFPIDTGSVVAMKLLNPDNRLPATMVSCNMYADRAETIVLGKAAADAARLLGRRPVAVAVTALSNRLHTKQIEPKDDRISSHKDDEWNQKILEILEEGRLEDVSQLARTFSAQANGDNKFKALWWLAAFMGQHNNYEGEVLEYQPIWGTGATVTVLTPSNRPAQDQEFDEEDVDYYRGDRNVLATEGADAPPTAPQVTTEPLPEGTTPEPYDHAVTPAAGVQRTPENPFGTSDDFTRDVTPVSGLQQVGAPIHASANRNEWDDEPLTDVHDVEESSAPKPVGESPHARRVGHMLYLSGVGPIQPGTGAIPGGPVRDSSGRKRSYDIRAQTEATIDNVRRILEASGSKLEWVQDITVFLLDMDRDFLGFNDIYAKHFGHIRPTRTTLAVSSFPSPIAVELKVMATAMNPNRR